MRNKYPNFTWNIDKAINLTAIFKPYFYEAL